MNFIGRKSIEKEQTKEQKRFGHGVIDRATSLGASEKNSSRTWMCVMIIAVTGDNPATHLPSLTFLHNNSLCETRSMTEWPQLNIASGAAFKGADQNHHAAFYPKIKGLLDDGFLTASFSNGPGQSLKSALTEPVCCSGRSRCCAFGSTRMSRMR
jgi:hypothetical protein